MPSLYLASKELARRNQVLAQFPPTGVGTRRGASMASLYLASKELARRNHVLAQFPPTGVGTRRGASTALPVKRNTFNNSP